MRPGYNDIANGKQVRAFIARFFHCGKRVCGLTRLADACHHSLRADNSIAIAKFGRVVDFDRHTCEGFNQKLSDICSMQRRAHSNDV